MKRHNTNPDDTFASDDGFEDDPSGDRTPRGRGRGHGHGPWGRGGPWERADWMRGEWGPPERRGRGAIRLAVLLVLRDAPMHGYQLIQELTERSGGAWRPSPGAIYPTLHRLEDKGLVRSDDSDERRVFSLTDAGRTVADRLAAEGVAPWQAPSGDSRQARQEARELKDQVGQLMGAVGQVFRAGTSAQRQKVQALLAETRRGIYRIMAEDEPAPAGEPATPVVDPATAEAPDV